MGETGLEIRVEVRGNGTYFRLSLIIAIIID
jgi:hypothetical protein